MNKNRLKYRLFACVIILFISNLVVGQSYKKDSLQIKTYTEINYKNSKAESIKLKKVFCDYCNKKQLESIGEEALFRADTEKYFPENKMKNGKKRLAIYIRISKADFAELKEEE